MQNNWCLFTAYDERFARVAKRTVPAMRRYADCHRMDFAEHTDCRIEPASWSKLHLAKEKFSQGYEFVFWVDADAAIRRFDEDIRDQIDDLHDLYFAFEPASADILPATMRLNSGVFVWRNSPATHRFIEAILSKRDFLHHKWWEQAAIIAALGLWSHFNDDHRPDEPTELFRLVKWLPSRWNCMMGTMADPAAVIRHFIGMNEGGKLFGLELDELLDRPSRDQRVEEEFQRIIRERLWYAMRSVHFKKPPPVRKNRRRKRRRSGLRLIVARMRGRA